MDKHLKKWIYLILKKEIYQNEKEINEAIENSKNDFKG